MWNKFIVCTDIETTGLLPGLHEIIEIGAVKLRQPDLAVVGWFNTKVRPDRIEMATPKALEVNGYTAEAWQDAPSAQEAMESYVSFASGCVFAAYNMTFDWSFIESTLVRLNIKNTIDYHRIDVLTLAWQYLMGRGLYKVNLKAVCQHMGVKPEPDVHRAVNGALTAARVMRAICLPREHYPLDVLEKEMDSLEADINKESLTVVIPEVPVAVVESEKEREEIDFS